MFCTMMATPVISFCPPFTFNLWHISSVDSRMRVTVISLLSLRSMCDSRSTVRSYLYTRSAAFPKPPRFFQERPTGIKCAGALISIRESSYFSFARVHCLTSPLSRIVLTITGSSMRMSIIAVNRALAWLGEECRIEPLPDQAF